MLNLRASSAYVISLGLHVVLMGAMWFIKVQIDNQDPELVLETIFDEERVQEEFEQELETSTEIADTLNVVAGGMVSTQVGANTAPAVNQQKIETSESLKEPEIEVNPGEITIPGTELLGGDLGAGEVSGEVGAVVEGYGAALSQMTQELIRLMRENKILVVWLFDESESMADDREEIRQKFHKVYEELGIATQQDERLRRDDDVLLTSIMSFGEKVHEHTPPGKPTSKVNAIRTAIDKIANDESGEENMCQSIAYAIEQYTKMSQRTRRKLVLVVVSDESGDDGEFVEETLSKAKRVKAPIYVMGRYSAFGYPYVRQIWKDPKYGLNHWLRIRRGPETPMPEALQWDGLRSRYDYFSAGFGPYEQVRLCKESGGIFFLLPGEEDNITGIGSHLDRKFAMLDMREYLPDLSARTKYVQERNASKFRKTQWDVIVRLNPHLDDKLNIRDWNYAGDWDKFAEQGKREFDKAMYAFALSQEGIELLEAIEPLRAQETSERWRANYDLMLAQLLMYRVRLFQFMLALDAHQKNKPKVSDPKHNAWLVRRVPDLLEPDEKQIKQTKVSMAELEAQQQRATREFRAVIENHEGTPWAQRANFELSQGFGMRFASFFWDPNYARVGRDIKLPNF